MDGVIVDFNKGVSDKFGVDVTDADTRALHKLIGVSSTLFWKTLNESSTWWAELEPYPWLEELVDLIEKRGSWYLCTAAASLAALHGRVRWIKRIFGSQFDRFVFTRHKHLLARPHTLLIDDTPKQVEDFSSEEGARAVLFPQPWNQATYDISEFMDVLRVSQ